MPDALAERTLYASRPWDVFQDPSASPIADPAKHAVLGAPRESAGGQRSRQNDEILCGLGDDPRSPSRGGPGPTRDGSRGHRLCDVFRPVHGRHGLSATGRWEHGPHGPGTPPCLRLLRSICCLTGAADQFCRISPPGHDDHLEEEAVGAAVLLTSSCEVSDAPLLEACPCTAFHHHEEPSVH